MLLAALVLVQATVAPSARVKAPSLPIVLRPLAPAEAAIIQNAVREELSDPESARFKMLAINKNSGKYCAFVNARNRFGGYAGFKSFSVFVTKNKAGQVAAASNAGVESNNAFIANLSRAFCNIEGYEMPVDKAALKAG